MGQVQQSHDGMRFTHRGTKEGTVNMSDEEQDMNHKSSPKSKALKKKKHVRSNSFEAKNKKSLLMELLEQYPA